MIIMSSLGKLQLITRKVANLYAMVRIFIKPNEKKWKRQEKKKRSVKKWKQTKSRRQSDYSAHIAYWIRISQPHFKMLSVLFTTTILEILFFQRKTNMYVNKFEAKHTNKDRKRQPETWRK